MNGIFEPIDCKVTRERDMGFAFDSPFRRNNRRRYRRFVQLRLNAVKLATAPKNPIDREQPRLTGPAIRNTSLDVHQLRIARN